MRARFKQNVAQGSTVYTDELRSFTGLQEAGFRHVSRNQPLQIAALQGLQEIQIHIPAGNHYPNA